MICPKCNQASLDFIQSLGNWFCRKCDSGTYEDISIAGHALSNEQGKALLKLIYDRLVLGGGKSRFETLEMKEGARQLYWQMQALADAFLERGDRGTEGNTGQ